MGEEVDGCGSFRHTCSGASSGSGYFTCHPFVTVPQPDLRVALQRQSFAAAKSRTRLTDLNSFEELTQERQSFISEKDASLAREKQLKEELASLKLELKADPRRSEYREQLTDVQNQIQAEQQHRREIRQMISDLNQKIQELRSGPLAGVCLSRRRRESSPSASSVVSGTLDGTVEDTQVEDAYLDELAPNSGPSALIPTEDTQIEEAHLFELAPELEPPAIFPNMPLHDLRGSAVGFNSRGELSEQVGLANRAEMGRVGLASVPIPLLWYILADTCLLRVFVLREILLVRSWWCKTPQEVVKKPSSVAQTRSRTEFAHTPPTPESQRPLSRRSVAQPPTSWDSQYVKDATTSQRRIDAIACVATEDSEGGSKSVERGENSVIPVPTRCSTCTDLGREHEGKGRRRSIADNAPKAQLLIPSSSNANCIAYGVWCGVVTYAPKPKSKAIEGETCPDARDTSGDGMTRLDVSFDLWSGFRGVWGGGDTSEGKTSEGGGGEVSRWQCTWSSLLGDDVDWVAPARGARLQTDYIQLHTCIVSCIVVCLRETTGRRAMVRRENEPKTKTPDEGITNAHG
ncbi:hypothetical protein FB45DRAFT_1121898 [Roridomyces roridus]|uniref:Uncharacterized protein n=1 Tax=Roridomyces roridus TaxID=1738132 RepID=A0AAD7FBH6_9AGAR|nr:hypothetical protein FB45DRAFT_1121898 [Roridomyces roridus]